MSLPYEREEKKISNDELITTGREILRKEAASLEAAAGRLGDEIARAAHLVSRCRGRVVVSGLGKSGHVGRKSAATFASLGVPAFFLHATEGAHGDLGMVCREDVGYFLSNSGETHELIDIIPYFKRIGAPIIAVTGNPQSSLAREADVVLNSHVDAEADPLGLAPTSSTTLQMAIGDAVAGMATLLLGLQKEDFALFHPGGSLGKRLLLRVRDLMGSGDKLPVTNVRARVRDAIFDITSKGYGATAIVGRRRQTRRRLHRRRPAPLHREERRRGARAPGLAGDDDAPARHRPRPPRGRSRAHRRAVGGLGANRRRRREQARRHGPHPRDTQSGGGVAVSAARPLRGRDRYILRALA